LPYFILIFPQKSVGQQESENSPNIITSLFGAGAMKVQSTHLCLGRMCKTMPSDGREVVLSC